MPKNRRDYTKYSKTEVIQNGESTPIVETSSDINIDAKPIVIGYVDNCARLNVRNAPNTHSQALCTIDRYSEIEIDESQSTEDFYKICTAAGIEGYCVKYFITIKS